MKDKEKRNKKGSESTIGKIIYGFLLFMPLFAIGSTILVNTFNNKAKEEVKITYKYQSNEVNNIDDLITSNIYHFTCSENYNTIFNLLENDGTLQGTLLYVNYFDTNLSSAYLDEAIYTDSGSYALTSFYMDVSSIILYTPNNENYISTYIEFRSNELVIFDFIFILDDYSNLWSGGITNYFEYTDFNVIENVEQKDISNVFYDAVDKVTESPLFSWAENSIIYTTTNATCNALSITTPFIPLLLSYWLIISVMYFLYDIALMLIWVLHDRIHALKDSIT